MSRVYVIKKPGSIDPILYLNDKLNNYLWTPNIKSADKFKTYDDVLDYLLNNPELEKDHYCGIRHYDID